MKAELDTDADYADASEIDGGYIRAEGAQVTRTTSYQQAVVPGSEVLPLDGYSATGAARYHYGPANNSSQPDPNYAAAEDGEQIYAIYDGSAATALSSVYEYDSAYEPTGEKNNSAVPGYGVVGPVTAAVDVPDPRKNTIWSPPDEQLQQVCRNCRPMAIFTPPHHQGRAQDSVHATKTVVSAT